MIKCNLFLHLLKSIRIMADEKKQERAVVHLELDGQHSYYGNLKALCDSNDRDMLGVSYNYLRNYGLDIDHPYIGKKCTIRKGIIVTSPRKEKK